MKAWLLGAVGLVAAVLLTSYLSNVTGWDSDVITLALVLVLVIVGGLASAIRAGIQSASSSPFSRTETVTAGDALKIVAIAVCAWGVSGAWVFALEHRLLPEWAFWVSAMPLFIVFWAPVFLLWLEARRWARGIAERRLQRESERVGRGVGG